MSRKIIDYFVVTHWKADLLSIEVTRLIGQGWELYGSPCFPLELHQYERYTQAMVKYEDQCQTVLGNINNRVLALEAKAERLEELMDSAFA